MVTFILSASSAFGPRHRGVIRAPKQSSGFGSSISDDANGATVHWKMRRLPDTARHDTSIFPFVFLEPEAGMSHSGLISFPPRMQEGEIATLPNFRRYFH